MCEYVKEREGAKQTEAGRVSEGGERIAALSLSLSLSHTCVYFSLSCLIKNELKKPSLITHHFLSLSLSLSLSLTHTHTHVYFSLSCLIKNELKKPSLITHHSPSDKNV